MIEYQITYWQDIPSMIVFKSESETTKSILANRFQEAIDEAAMRIGAVDSDAYLAGWKKGDWIKQEGILAEVSEKIVSELEEKYPQEKLLEILANL
jgi:hypothetical protein